MKRSIVSLTLMLFSLHAQCTDLVMIDTGTVDTYTGTLNMPATCILSCWHPHGENMAKALQQQLQIINSKPVNATHVTWAVPSDIPAAIRFAVSLKPIAISMSLAGDYGTDLEYEAMMQAEKAGILVLAASGNDGRDHSEYPAGYGFSCLVSVSAQMNGHRAKWGSQAIASVGEIYLPGRPSDFGTSPSVQRAAAIALRYKESHPKADCHELKAYLLFRFGSKQFPR